MLCYLFFSLKLNLLSNNFISSWQGGFNSSTPIRIGHFQTVDSPKGLQIAIPHGGARNIASRVRSSAGPIHRCHVTDDPLSSAELEREGTRLVECQNWQEAKSKLNASVAS